MKLLLLLLAVAAVCAQKCHCDKDRFTSQSFAGKYDIEYHSTGGDSRAFNGALSIYCDGEVDLAYLSGFVFNKTILTYSYPVPQVGNLQIISEQLGIAKLSFPNPADLAQTNTPIIFARLRDGRVTSFTGSFVSLGQYVLLLTGTRTFE